MSIWQDFPQEGSQLRIPTLLPEKFEHPLTGALIYKQLLPPRHQNTRPCCMCGVSKAKGSRWLSLKVTTRKKFWLGLVLQLLYVIVGRCDQPRYIWCDSLFVIQDDLDEQATQVFRMGDIYRSSSSSCLAWTWRERQFCGLKILDHVGSNVRFDPVTWDVSPPRKYWSRTRPSIGRSDIFAERLGA